MGNKKRNESVYTWYKYFRKEFKVYHAEILDLAEMREDYRSISEMDDDSFYYYCDILVRLEEGIA